MLLTIQHPEDLEDLWRVFEELRDVQEVGLTKLPQYCSGWSWKTDNILVRADQELSGNRTLHVKVLFGAHDPKIAIRISSAHTPKMELVPYVR